MANVRIPKLLIYAFSQSRPFSNQYLIIHVYLNTHLISSESFRVSKTFTHSPFLHEPFVEKLLVPTKDILNEFPRWIGIQIALRDFIYM